MNVSKYLSRIKFKNFSNPDLRSLKKLHRNHLYNIPFENLDIHRNSRIILNQKLLEKKILDRQRGGYCYELNGMFYHLLKKLGYKVKLVSARVRNSKGGWGAEFDHAAILVKLDELWLADVGFGDNFIHPVKMKVELVQNDSTGYYKIVNHDGKYLKLMRSKNGKKFEDNYIFTLKNRKWREFEGMNSFHQTSPESHFTEGRVCTLALPGGRITLTDTKLIFTTPDGKRSRKINEAEFGKLLQKYFKINQI